MKSVFRNHLAKLQNILEINFKFLTLKSEKFYKKENFT
ncbi:hypothetical protein BHF72_0165 [Cloacibacterium normanense]|uniref:Uncharacterized protein n=1 Tax=Cloacibacterium normanense TaxID=237258 RepID=A0A1E5UD28_9FLAO|nr:hypothetical protein BHF72_0165 [Cloacibacterium normanense]